MVVAGPASPTRGRQPILMLGLLSVGSLALFGVGLAEIGSSQETATPLKLPPSDRLPRRTESVALITSPPSDRLPQRMALSEHKSPVVIGIAGGSGSGKTTLARAIAKRLGKQLLHLEFDSYYKDLAHQTSAERAKANFDHPDSLDAALLQKHLLLLKSGGSIDVPVYDFATHTRRKQPRRVTPAPLILVEGILLFSVPELATACDIKIFVDAEPDLRFSRRLRRDIVERSRSVDAIIGQWEETVKPMHDKYVQPSKRVADIIVPNGMNPVAVEMVVARLESLLHSRG